MGFNQFPLGVTDLVLPLHVLRNSRFLLWAFSDRAWDSCISALLEAQPRSSGVDSHGVTQDWCLVPKVSSEMHLAHSSEHSLGWPSLPVGEANLTIPLGWLSHCLCPPPQSCKCCSLRPLPIQTSCEEAVFRIRSGGSRLREAPSLHQTFTSFLTLNFDGSAIARWQSSVLPSGPCNKNRLGRGWVARIAENYFQLFAWLQEATGHAVLEQSQGVFGSITWRPDIHGREL